MQIHTPWNKDRIIGQKMPLQISCLWGIRIRLELAEQTRDLGKFKVSEVVCGRSVLSRMHVVQQNTGSPV